MYNSEFLKESFEEHLRFEKLIANLSSKLVNLPFDKIDQQIVDCMQLVTDFFQVDRCQIGQLNKNENKIFVSHYYSLPHIESERFSSIGDHALPYIYNEIINNKVVAINNVNEMPPAAHDDIIDIKNIKLQSFLIVPIMIDSKVCCAMSLSTFNSTIEWTDSIIEHFRIVGNILSNALNRQILLENQILEKKWADDIIKGMPQLAYVFDAQGKMKRWNKNIEKILGYKPEELKDKPVIDFIADEDKQKVYDAFMKVIETGEETSLEYDLVSKSGERFPYRGSGSYTEINGEKFLIGMTIDMRQIKESQILVAEQFEEITILKNEIEAENIYLKEEIKQTHNFHEIVGKHETLLHTLYRIEKGAPNDVTVLLEGETGTGKELFARAIHTKSKRKNKPLITLNCASIPLNLFESELFGHEKGAFTGAISTQIGKFELAEGGTIFLDEVGELPYDIQAKLLRVLQEGTFERIGGKKTKKADVRIIAATNRDLELEVENKKFRSDLYYRLNVFPISIAPLRARISDIDDLTNHFIKIFNKKFGKKVTRISKINLKRLQRYNWPGNVRELENIIERGMILSDGAELILEPLPTKKNEFLSDMSLKDFEKKYITQILEKTYWKVNGIDGAAQILDLHPETLRSKMKKLGIVKPAQ